MIRVQLYSLFYSKPDVLISFGISAGDDLLCTIIARQLSLDGYKKIWVGTCFPEIFSNNPYVQKTLIQDENGKVSLFMQRYMKHLRTRIINPWYTCRNEITDQDIIPQKHIVEIMCDRAGVNYPEIIKADFFLTEPEKEQGKLYPNQVCIQTSGIGAKLHMKTKDWIPERFAEVAEVLGQNFIVIQIGSDKDYLLPGVIDMRGKTSIREVAAILYQSKFFVGQVGFLMHLARAVDCRSVIIYGGRERPDQSGYEENINLYSAVTCAPCWYWNTCTNDMICMKQITASDIILSLKKSNYLN